ncbi:MAG: hypothetical protein ACLFVY_05660 [Phycisphaerae bacterium]
MTNAAPRQPAPIVLCLALLLAAMPTIGSAADDANATRLTPRKIASDLSNWRILPDSRILLLSGDDGLTARYVADKPADSREIKLRDGLGDAVSLGGCTVGFTQKRGGFDVVNVKTDQRRTVLQTSGPVAPMPLDANTALLIEKPVRHDPNQHTLRVHRLDLDTLRTKPLWKRQGVQAFSSAQPVGDDPNQVRLWFYLASEKPRPAEGSTRTIVFRNNPVTQATLNIKTGHARESTLSSAEARRNGLTNASGRVRSRSHQARQGRFRSPDGKATVTIEGKRLTLTRRGSSADLFGGRYETKVYPSSDSAKPRRLAIVKTADEKRELIVMDLKTLDKTKLATFTELDSVKGWSPSGRFLVAEQYSPTNLDDHGHLVAYEPAKWRKVSIFPQEDQKYVTLLGFVPIGWAVVAGDTMIEDAIRKTRLSVVDLANPKRRYTVAQGRLFRVTAIGDELIFSDFDGEHYTLYRAAMPERKKTTPRRDGND